jgi:hypothetical protein
MKEFLKNLNLKEFEKASLKKPGAESYCIVHIWRWNSWTSSV